MVADAIPFQKSIRPTIEHSTGNSATLDESGSAFFYCQATAPLTEKDLPAGASPCRSRHRRIWAAGLIEGEASKVVKADGVSAVVSTADFGPEFNGGQALAFTPQGTTGTICAGTFDPKPAHNDRVEVWANPGLRPRRRPGQAPARRARPNRSRRMTPTRPTSSRPDW